MTLSRSQLKTHYKKTATVHTFARLLDLLNDNNSSSSTVDAHGYTHSAPGHDHDSRGKNLKVRIEELQQYACDRLASY